MGDRIENALLWAFLVPLGVLYFLFVNATHPSPLRRKDKTNTEESNWDQGTAISAAGCGIFVLLSLTAGFVRLQELFGVPFGFALIVPGFICAVVIFKTARYIRRYRRNHPSKHDS